MSTKMWTLPYARHPKMSGYFRGDRSDSELGRSRIVGVNRLSGYLQFPLHMTYAVYDVM